MNQQPLKYLNVGACNWAPADWSIRFYPDDLPADWQFSYYANEFRQVFITAEQWHGTVAEVLSWRDELPDDFRLFLEITEQQLNAPDWAKTAEVLATLNWGAVVRDEHLAEALRGIVCRVDLWLEGEHLLRPLWQSDDDKVQLAVFRSETALDPLQLRALFEHFGAAVKRPELLVFLDTPYETTEKMRQMCELYGW